MRIAGIMSGTSLDGIDVAIIDRRGRYIQVLAHRTTPYPATVREALLGISNCQTHTREIARLNFRLGELYAQALRRTCTRARIPLDSIELIGCHGQTIYHEGSGPRACTMQIGESAVLAERTGLPVVNDFRVADMAAGGQGAPLVPFLDYLLFSDRRKNRVALNVGGIANITTLPAGAGPEQSLAFDTGPGNMVMDQLTLWLTEGRQQYDKGGALAAQGQVRETLLRELLQDAYYRRKPPKTAGREQYGTEFVKRLIGTNLPLLDLIATATAFTAATIARGIQKFGPSPLDEVIAAGGGVHNRSLMQHLAADLPGTKISTTASYGIDADAKEAVAFAVLASENWRGQPGNLPSATGARHAILLGKQTRV